MTMTIKKQVWLNASKRQSYKRQPLIVGTVRFANPYSPCPGCHHYKPCKDCIVRKDCLDYSATVGHMLFEPDHTEIMESYCYQKYLGIL